MSELRDGANPGDKKGFSLGKHWRKIVLAIAMVAAIALATNGIVTYEGKKVKNGNQEKPIPVLTGSTIWPINSVQEAMTSNNDFILVITPVSDDALNTSVTSIVTQAANKIRSTDKIYVGVFMLPKSTSAANPTVLLRLLGTGRESSLYGVTLRNEITADGIYTAYLDRKYLRN
jgi:hypothetical protein